MPKMCSETPWRRHAAAAFILVAFLLSACSSKQSAGEMPTVFVSIAPQAYFVKRIAGETVDIQVLVSPGQSPATYEVTPNQMAALTDAGVLFAIGVPFERRLLAEIKSSSPGLRVVRTDRGLPYYLMDLRGGSRSQDPHVWLDPQLVKHQVATMCDVLCDLVPGDSQVYRSNLATFERDLDSVDALIRQILGPVTNRTLYVYHASFGYFAKAFDLTQVAVEPEGKEPSARQLADLTERAMADSARAIYVQPQFSSRTAEALAESIGAVVVPIDPLAQDYLENLVLLALTIREWQTEEGFDE